MNGKKVRAAASLFMSVVLSATLMVPNIAFAQTTTDKDATATTPAATQTTAAPAATTATQATNTTTATTAQSATASPAPATAAETPTASVDQGTTATAAADTATTSSASAATTATAATASSASTVVKDSTSYATGLTVDPLAIEKQNALNESYNQALAAQQSQSENSGALTAQSTSTLPSSYDLRKVNGKVFIDAVRQQGNLGDCWANSTSSCVESNILKQIGGASEPGQTLSARQLSWNISKPVNSKTVIMGRAIDSDQYGEGMVVPFGDGVSSSMQGAQILTSWQGMASESGSQGIPFQDSTGNKAAQPSDKWAITEAQRDWAVAHVTDVEMLPTPANLSEDSKGNPVYSYNEAGTTAIKQALMGNGAVQMNYFAMLPDDTAFNGTFGAQYIDLAHRQSYQGQAHSVTVVGWDDTFSADHFGTSAKPAGDGAFLCKNSWGSYGDTATIKVEVNGKQETVSKRTYTDASGNEYSLYKEKDASGTFNFYKIVTGIVDMSAPVLSGLSDYDKYDSLNPVYIDASGNTYTIHSEKASGTEASPTWQGCFWLSYYDASIMQAASYKVDAPAANASGTYQYTHEYMYDYLGTASLLDTAEGAYDTTTTSASTGATTTNIVQAANVFTAKANEALTAVSAVTQSAASTVQLFIYRLINGAKSPTQSATGSPELTMTVTEANAGYHTIALSKPLYLHAGESFSVVERIMNAKGQGYLPIELAASSFNGNTWKAMRGAGESYISTDGGKTWTDVNTLSTDYFPMSKIANGDAYVQSGVKLIGFGNVEIRAFTTDWTPAPTPTPATPAATATTASYTPAAATAAAQPELPKTADDMGITCMLLVLLVAAGMGTAIGARRKSLQ